MSKNFITLHRNQNVSRPSASNPVSAQAIYYPFVVAPCKVRFEYQARGKFFVMVNYKRIYERAFGIQWDRTLYEIHHVDRNRENNEIGNLLLIPKEVHERIHKIESELLGQWMGIDSVTGLMSEIEHECCCGGSTLGNGLQGYLSLKNNIMLWSMLKSQRYRNGFSGKLLNIEGIWNAK